MNKMNSADFWAIFGVCCLGIFMIELIVMYICVELHRKTKDDDHGKQP